MIDSKIFEQAKNDIHARREDTARKIFEKIAKEATALNLTELYFSLSDMWEVTDERTLSAKDFLRLIEEYLPEDSGVTCTLSTTCPPTFIFSFDWLK